MASAVFMDYYFNTIDSRINLPFIINYTESKFLSQFLLKIINGVLLNKEALLAFWNEGETWSRQEVAAHLDTLKKI